MATLPATNLLQKLNWNWRSLLLIIVLTCVGIGELVILSASSRIQQPIPTYPHSSPTITRIPTIHADETTGWKTFTKYGFSFKYPPTYLFYDATGMKETQGLLAFVNLLSCPTHLLADCNNSITNRIDFTKYDNASHSDLETWVKTSLIGPVITYPCIQGQVKKTQTTMQGHQAITYEFTIPKDQPACTSGDTTEYGKFYFVVIDDKDSVITVTVSDATDDKYAELKMIASTFSFAPEGTIMTQESGIKGTITIGPSCPIDNGTPGCKDKPYKATIAIKSLDGKTILGEFQSDETGAFSYQLPPGTYLLDTPTQRVSPPTMKPQTITVIEGAYTSQNLSFDSGIR